MRYFGTSFLCKCSQPILQKITASSGNVEFTSIVQNRTESASDSEILIESFSDEEDIKDVKRESNGNASIEDSPDLKSHHDAAEIRKLLRRKDELERKQKMDERYKERLQVSDPIPHLTTKSFIKKHTQKKCLFTGFCNF